MGLVNNNAKQKNITPIIDRFDLRVFENFEESIVLIISGIDKTIKLNEKESESIYISHCKDSKFNR